MTESEYILGANIHNLIQLRQIDGLRVKSAAHWKPKVNLERNLKSPNSSPSSSPPFNRFQCPLRDGESIQPIIGNCSSFVSRLKVEAKLKTHSGCVNTVEWNEDGSRLITGSDDCTIKVWNGGPSYSLIQSYRTGHRRNIFSARFVPQSNDTKFVSCGMDGQVRLTELKEGGGSANQMIDECDGMMYKIFFVPNLSPSVFLTTQQDGIIKMYDLRESSSAPSPSFHQKTLMRLSRNQSANSLAFDPLSGNQFIVGGASHQIKLFDIRYLLSEEKKEGKALVGSFCPQVILDNSKRVNITGVDFNRQNEIVATYSKEEVYLFNVNDLSNSEYLNSQNVVQIPRQVYKGRTNAATFLKEVCFLDGGYSRESKSGFVATGSDCGHLFIWEKHSGELVQMIKGDHSIVNGVAPHPSLPHLAVCGIDHYAKVLEPSAESSTFDSNKAKSTMESNFSRESDDETDDFDLFQLLIQALRARNNDPQRAARIQRENEMLEESERIRTEANQFFRNGDFEGALAKYQEAFAVLVSSAWETNRVDESRLHCLNNSAACYLRLERWGDVVDVCDEALAIDPTNYKSFFRRAQAKVGLDQNREAYFDLKKALRYAPEESAPPIQTLKDAVLQKHPEFLEIPSEDEEMDEAEEE